MYIYIYIYMYIEVRGVLSHGGTPSYHPFFFGIFHELNHPAIGVPTYISIPVVHNSCYHRNSGRIAYLGKTKTWSHDWTYDKSYMKNKPLHTFTMDTYENEHFSMLVHFMGKSVHVG